MFGQQCGMPGGTHHNECVQLQHVISSFKCIIFPVLTDEVKYEQMYILYVWKECRWMTSGETD